MGVRILHDRDDNQAALYCSTTGWAFGPVFHDGKDGHDAQERAESFCRWLHATDGRDPQQLTDSELERRYSEWLAQEPAQWQREDEDENGRHAVEFVRMTKAAHTAWTWRFQTLAEAEEMAETCVNDGDADEAVVTGAGIHRTFDKSSGWDIQDDQPATEAV